MLSPEAQKILDEMYSGKELQGTNGVVEIDQITRVDEIAGEVLYRLIQQSGAQKSLEIGLAYGFSTIWILDALPEGGSHIALDPFQSSLWHGVGEAQARRLPGKKFSYLEEYSIHALSDFIRAGEQFDFIFIDGAHRFDDVLVDFYLADKVLKPGGVMVLDDIWMASILTVANFVSSNRAYQPIRHRSTRMSAYRKLKEDDRDWRHFLPFEVAAS
jgi:predicted O-methyltransferase YrrM